jgi:hypothetical protein
VRDGVAGLFLIVLGASALGAGAFGCGGEEPIPASPTFEPTIRTLLQAHCVRCHGAGGTLNTDPASLYKDMAGQGYFNRYEDRDCVPLPDLSLPADCQKGARSEVITIKTYIHLAESDPVHMPPLPSDPLTSWELQLLDNWLDEPDPLP